MGIVCTLLLPHSSRIVYLTTRPFIRVKGGSKAPSRSLPRSLARCDSTWSPPPLEGSIDVQRLAYLAMLDSLLGCLPHLNGYHVRYGEMARKSDTIIRAHNRQIRGHITKNPRQIHIKGTASSRGSLFLYSAYSIHSIYSIYSG